ncbi:macro domain-containing protein [Puia dinghuensis]|uniref:Macro domain-containing protein n=1 Tax=Puia dinghuensis TaxID=1792502 RepID=A0A8J2UIR5_9BACT|nr:macro domain-containing protein [Puia dinghuensis]GGB23681.1 hypothetical protein GCM10011511_54430 [Puia dinghuensis]
MIEYAIGDLLAADVQALVKEGGGVPGKMMVTWDSSQEGEKMIVHFPTKTHFSRKSQYSYIEEGLKDLVRVIGAWRIASIALPPLGCGNGGLQWAQVRPLIEQYLGDSPARVVVFEPNGEAKTGI